VEPPKGFRHRTTIPVRFRDVDLMGHVNNAVYFTYLEQARIDYFRDLFAQSPAVEHPPGFIVASARLDFRSPVAMDDRVHVFLRTVEMGRTSFKLEYEIWSEALRARAAAGETVQVVYDYAARAAVPLSPALRAALEAFEGRPIPAKKPLEAPA
jgi:acyl-CoA thioester hydrolase